MEAKKVSTQIIDHIDGQPSIVLSNGNWGVFDPKTNMYKDTGIKASPEDDSSAVKYYILGNETTPPEAPSQTGGWSTLASLNASLAQAGWSEDPLQTESTNRYCWVATYGKENIVDTVATEAEGHLVFKPKFTRTNVRLWSNYANSPTISVVGNEIIITNPDGSVVTQKFATTEAIADIANLITSLQEQMDGSVYSYSLEGEPSMTKAPVTMWIDGVDPSLIADIYSQHVGDTYTDLLTYVSYRFALIQGSASDPSNYGWKVIEDSALTNALGEIARLGREKITIFTEQPNEPYKKGDMWLDGEVMLHAIQSSDVFNLAHWVQPYATKAEVNVIEQNLQQAAADATLAKNNLASLESNLTSMTGTVADAIKDNIISDTELMDLNAELKQLDIDQETLLTTVNYLLDSIYLPATPKETLQTRSNASIAVGGSMDIYQAQITTMITDKVITTQERADYLSKFNTYKNDLKLLNEAISGASSAIEGELKRLADEKVDNLEIGGRNLATRDNTSAFRGEGYFNETSNTWVLNPKAAAQGLSISLTDINQNEDYVLTYYIKYVSGELENFGGHVNSVTLKKLLVDGVNIPALYHQGLDKSLIEDGLWHKVNMYFEQQTIPTIGNNRIAIELNRYATEPFDSVFEVKDIKLEKGNKATDWTPAPEDVQAEIDEVNTDLTNLGTEIDTAFSNLSITNIEANSLDLLRKSLAKEVADVVTIANTYTVSVTDINAKLAALNTEINKYTGKADSVYPITVTTANRTAIETTFSNLEASIVALYEAIDNKRVDSAVIKATYWSIKASTPVIYKDANSATANGVHTPVTVNGELRSGTTITQGGFISIQPNGGAESTATASPRNIAPTDTEGKTSYTVRLYEKADKATLLDTMTIPVVFKGSSGINVAMSNEADVLPATPTGEVTDYADTGNVIRVFEGANELAYTKPTTAIVKGAAVDISTKNVTNEVENGDFRNGTTGWGGRGTLSIVGGYLNVMSNGSDTNMLASNTTAMPMVAGDKIYSMVEARATNSMVAELAVRFKGVTSGGFHVINSIASPIINTWYNISGIETISSGLGEKLTLYVYAHYPTAAGGNGLSHQVKRVTTINLTQTFGAGNEPTKEECGRIFGGYFEGTVPLSDVALGGNGTYQVYPSPTGITEGTKSVSGLACSFANASNMTTDSAKITFNINGLSSSGIPFEFSRAQNFTKSKIGADGAEGEGGINVMITRQGSFRTYWRQIGDQGQILTAPEKVSEIIGGVEIGDVKYVQCKVLIYKGSVDVTASALADPTTQGKWYLNNEFISGTDTLNIPIIHADGVDDEVRFEYTDTNAKNWEGA